MVVSGVERGQKMYLQLVERAKRVRRTIEKRSKSDEIVHPRVRRAEEGLVRRVLGPQVLRHH